MENQKSIIGRWYSAPEHGRDIETGADVCLKAMPHRIESDPEKEIVSDYGVMFPYKRLVIKISNGFDDRIYKVPYSPANVVTEPADNVPGMIMVKNSPDWEQRFYEIAKDASTYLVSFSLTHPLEKRASYKEIAQAALEIARALVAELQNNPLTPNNNSNGTMD